jgi:polar amino acid transport system substrate-binding protein/glutamate/aspartate transport system substrate-binding protein
VSLRHVPIVLLASLLLAAGVQAQTLERVRESGSFKIGYRTDAAPFAYKDALGEAVGYSVELCRAVAVNLKQALGLAEIKVEYVPVSAEDRFQAVQDGRIDILCGATTVTLSRRELVDFSLFTFLDGAGVMLRADGPEDLTGLAGQKIGVRGATTTEDALRGMLAEIKMDAEVVTVASHDEGLSKLESGDVAAYFGDQAILIFLANRSDDPGKLKISDRQLTFEPYALALARGDADFRLLVDRTLAGIYRTGLIDQLFTNAFGPNADQSAALQAIYLINALEE